MNPVAIAAGSAALRLIERFIDKQFPDPEQAMKHKMEAYRMEREGQLQDDEAMLRSDAGQVAINVEDAKSGNTWQSGWRPGAGWTCVGGLFYQIIFSPILGWVAMNLWGWSAPPSLNMETLMTLLFGLLGLGYYRTKERISGKIK